MRCDVAIVGAGASGSFLAYNLAKRGYKTVVIEKKPSIGGKVCGGLVSDRVVKLSKTESILNEIVGADIEFPNGECLRIEGKKTYGYVLNRDIFDSELADNALSEGVTYKLNFNVNHIKDNVIHGKEPIRFHYLVGADGAKSGIADRFRMGTLGYINAIQGESKKWDGESEYVKVILDTSISPGFFSWLIPYGSTVKIGLGSSMKDLKNKFNRLADRVQLSPTNIRGGIIPVGLRTMFRDNVVLIGDAAGLVKATSGGGLYMGLSAATILADHFDDWRTYKKIFMKEHGREIKRTLLAHKLFCKLANDDFNTIAEYVKKDIDIVARHGDIDYQSTVAKLLVKRHPSLLWLGRKFL